MENDVMSFWWLETRSDDRCAQFKSKMAPRLNFLPDALSKTLLDFQVEGVLFGISKNGRLETMFIFCFFSTAIIASLAGLSQKVGAKFASSFILVLYCLHPVFCFDIGFLAITSNPFHRNCIEYTIRLAVFVCWTMIHVIFCLIFAMILFWLTNHVSTMLLTDA